MGRKSKQKGAAFELLVVKEIRKAINKKMKDEVCFRTPRSGGHPMIGGADIQIKSKLRKVFPFAVECKHQKTIKTDKLFSVNKNIQHFLAQAIENTEERGDYPMLVIRGDRTEILCASTISAFNEAGYGILAAADTPGLIFKFRGNIWKWVRLKEVMKRLKHIVGKI